MIPARLTHAVGQIVLADVPFSPKETLAGAT